MILHFPLSNLLEKKKKKKKQTNQFISHKSSKLEVTRYYAWNWNYVVLDSTYRMPDNIDIVHNCIGKLHGKIPLSHMIIL